MVVLDLDEAEHVTDEEMGYFVLDNCSLCARVSLPVVDDVVHELNLAVHALLVDLSLRSSLSKEAIVLVYSRLGRRILKLGLWILHLI